VQCSAEDVNGAMGGGRLCEAEKLYLLLEFHPFCLHLYTTVNRYND
jgi:hypothetical protein